MRTLAALVTLLVSGCTLGPALFIERVGEGSGEVTSDPEGLHCGEDCALIVESPTITLVATPRTGSRFAGWSGPGCSGTEPCTLSLVSDETITATFDPLFQPLLVTRSGGGTGTVSSDPAGIACGEACTASFREGTTVTLAATPDAGSAFVGWSGACTGSSACTLPVELAATVDAQFAPLHTLTVTRSGDGMGRVTSSTSPIDCGSACTASVADGTTVALMATPVGNSKFVGWSGGVCSGNGPCVLTISGSVTVVAVFTIELPCTSTVTADEPAATFNTRLTTNGAVVCLAPGVRISGAVSIGAGGITIQSLPGGMAHLENLAGNAVSLNGHGARLIGLDINSDGPELTSAIEATGAGLTLRRSTVSCGSNNCYLVRLASGGSAVIENSTLTSGTAYSYGVYGYNNASVQITGSTVSSYGNALNVTVGSSFTVTDSTLIGLNPYTGGSNETISVWHAATLRLSGATVVTNGFRALRAGGNSAGATVHLDGTTFRQMAGLPAGVRSPLISERADNVFNSGTANTFCNEGTATDDLAFAIPLIGGDHAVTGTFDAVNQLAPGDCN